MNHPARTAALAALFGALTFIGSLIAIPVGPVPITMQTLFVLLAGFLLTPQTAFFAMVVHLILKLMTAGLAAVMTPSFGFVVAFIVVAPAISYASRQLPRTLGHTAAIALFGSLGLYAIGLPYMGVILNVYMGKAMGIVAIFKAGMLLFIPGDIAKAVVAVVLARRLQPALAKERR